MLLRTGGHAPIRAAAMVPRNTSRLVSESALVLVKMFGKNLVLKSYSFFCSFGAEFCVNRR